MTAPLPDSVRTSIEHGSRDLATHLDENTTLMRRLAADLQATVDAAEGLRRRLREHLATLDADDAAREAAGLPIPFRAVHRDDPVPEPQKEDTTR